MPRALPASELITMLEFSGAWKDSLRVLPTTSPLSFLISSPWLLTWIFWPNSLDTASCTRLA